MAEPTDTPNKILPRNIRLQILKLDVDDDRFLQIIGDFAGLIRRSERACEEASASGNPESAEIVADSESDYLEELIGASFLVLQAKIRRVDQAAERLPEFMQRQYGVSVTGLDRASLFALGGVYRDTGHSLIELIWAVGNYYKHRDEWDSEVWQEPTANMLGRDPLRQSRATRRIVEKIGIVQRSTGNMRTAYEFFGIYPYSRCEQLAEQVQDWAESVFALAKQTCLAAGGETSTGGR